MQIAVQLVPSYIEALVPYQAARSVKEVCRLYGLDHAIKLASNENPFGPSPDALTAISASLATLSQYPSGGAELRAVLARQFETSPANILAGSGSEAILSNIVQTFLCEDDEVLTADVTFPGFRVLAQSRGAACRTVPLRNWKLDLPGLAAAVDSRTKIIYLANPNNPTGAIFTRAEFEGFHSRIPERVLIVLDEAYYEYAKDVPEYPDSLDYRYDNVITLRTFSKAYGLAGARLGYGFGHEALISSLLKVKLPFEPSSLAEAAGIAALADTAWLARGIEATARGREYIARELSAMGVDVLPSYANFVMTLWPSPEAADGIVENLMKAGLIVRPLRSFGVPAGIRITVGTPDDNHLLISALRRIMQQEYVACNSPRRNVSRPAPRPISCPSTEPVTSNFG
ncbi:MAG: histidinol-phosphate transaminase [Acidobacteriota bacterium]